MKKKLIKNKISYEPEADILSFEVSNLPIDHAAEIGNVVVHFSKKDVPILFEVLEASEFLKNASRVMEKGIISYARKAERLAVAV